MAKHWRRSGGRGVPGVGTVTLADLGEEVASAEADTVLQAQPGTAAGWYSQWNGGGWVLYETSDWPWASTLIDTAGHHGDTLEVQVRLDTGLVVTSSPLVIA